MPAVIFPDGSVLERPDLSQVAGKLGLVTIPSRRFYDVIVDRRRTRRTRVCSLLQHGRTEDGSRGARSRRAARPDSVPASKTISAFPSGLSGADLARRGVAQVRRFGTEVLAPAEAVSLAVEGEYRVVKLSNGQELAAHSVVIAAGVQWRRLDVPGMDRLTGAGIYYGAAITESVILQRRRRLHRRRRELRRPGRGAFFRDRAVGHDDRSRRFACRSRCRTTSSNASRRFRTSRVVPNAEVVEVTRRRSSRRDHHPHHDTETVEKRPGRARSLSSSAPSRTPTGSRASSAATARASW